MTAILGRGGSEPSLGLVSALKVASDALTVWPGALNPTTANAALLATDSWRFPFWVLAFCIAGVLLIRSHSRTLLAAWVVSAAAFSGSVLGVAMIAGTPYNYLGIAIRPAAVMLIVVTLSSFVHSIAAISLPSALRVACWSTVALSVVFGVIQLSAPNLQAGSERVVAEFTKVVRETAPPGEIEVQMAMNDWLQMTVARGVLLQLEREGYRVEAPSLGERLVGAHRTGTSAPYVVRVADVESSRKLRNEGWEVLARQIRDVGDVAVLLGRER